MSSKKESKSTISRRKAIQLTTIGGAAVFSGCSFKYRGVNRLEAFGEGSNGFLANVEWVQPNHSTLVYLKENIPVILVNVKDEIKAYISVCPHTSCELNDGERYQPIVMKDQELRCYIHDSFFDIETGDCLRGPAMNTKFKGMDKSKLPEFPIKIENGRVYRESLLPIKMPETV